MTTVASARNLKIVKRSLARRATVLVVIPLGFQILFVGTLWALLAQEEHELDRARFARQVVERANAMVKTIFKLTAVMLNQGFRNGAAVPAVYLQLDQDCAALQELLKDSPSAVNTMHQVKAIMDRTRMYIEETRALVLLGRPDAATAYIGSARLLAASLTAELENLAQTFKRIDDAEPESQRRLRTFLMATIFVFVAGNAALVLWLLTSFNHTTINRLELLMDNTRRFAGGEPLLAELGGGDEIGRLDEVFHDMARQVSEMTRRRQEIMDMVAHDLRSPITAMSLSLELVLERAKNSNLAAEDRKEIGNCLTSMGRLLALINNFLDSEKLAAGKVDLALEMTPVALVLQESTQAIKVLCQSKGVGLVVADSDLEMYCDGQRLTQVLVNLLSNAVRYSPKGATITVTVQELSECVEIAVIDQGPGISAEKIETLFQAFSQVGSEKDRQGTSGLGLAICKTLVEMHAGQIGVESEVGKGTRFWFAIPKQPWAKPGANFVHSPGQPDAGGGQ